MVARPEKDIESGREFAKGMLVSPASWPSEEGVSSEERRGNIRGQTGVIHVEEAILVLEVSLEGRFPGSDERCRVVDETVGLRLSDRAKRELKKRESEKRKAKLVIPSPRRRNSEKDLVVWI
jgi:hypothetical protein